MTKKYIPGFGYVPDPDNPYYAKVAEIKKTKKLFTEAYPHADFKQFSIGPTFVTFNHEGTGYDVFIGKVGRGEKVHHYDGSGMKKYLEIALGKPWHAPPRFPLEYTLNKKVKYSIPTEDKSLSLKGLGINIAALLKPLKVYVSPHKSFNITPSNLFIETPPSYSTTDEYYKWMYGPKLHFWDQQLNFAVWCATSGCGVSWDMLEPDTQIAGFLRFHVLFTIRWTLNTLGCPPPWSEKFDNWNNPYSSTGLERLCNEFGISNPPDFRFDSKGGDKYGVPWGGGFYYSTSKSRKQYNWFIPKKGRGLTMAGLARLNRSIETFVYCILAAQASTRSSIIDTAVTGGAVETQQVFNTLFETSLSNDITKSVQRFQKAISDARVRLDLAIAPGLWLLPSDLKIQMTATYGYNNGLQKTTPEMRFGINEHVNVEKYQLALPKHIPPMEGKKPEAHKVNPVIQKQSVTHESKVKPVIPKTTTKHESSLIVVGILTAGLGWWFFR